MRVALAGIVRQRHHLHGRDLSGVYDLIHGHTSTMLTTASLSRCATWGRMRRSYSRVVISANALDKISSVTLPAATLPSSRDTRSALWCRWDSVAHDGRNGTIHRLFSIYTKKIHRQKVFAEISFIAFEKMKRKKMF